MRYLIILFSIFFYLTGHTKKIETTSITRTNTNKQLYFVGNNDGYIYIYLFINQKFIKKAEVKIFKNKIITNIKFSKDDKYIFLSSKKGLKILRKTNSLDKKAIIKINSDNLFYKEVETLESRAISCFTLNNQNTKIDTTLKILITQKGRMQIYRLIQDSLSHLQTIEYRHALYKKQIHTAQFSPDDNYIAFGSDDFKVNLLYYDHTKQSYVTTQNHTLEHSEEVTALFFLSNNTLISGDKSGSLIQWNNIFSPDTIIFKKIHKQSIVNLQTLGEDTLITIGKEGCIKFLYLNKNTAPSVEIKCLNHTLTSSIIAIASNNIIKGDIPPKSIRFQRKKVNALPQIDTTAPSPIILSRSNCKIDTFKSIDGNKHNYAYFFAIEEYKSNKHSTQFQNLPSSIDYADSLAMNLSKHYGFNCTILKNPNKRNIEEALDQLINEFKYSCEHTQVLLYFIGHGYTPKDRQEAYFVPSLPSKIEDEYQLKSHSYQYSSMIASIKQIMSNHLLVMVDACYSGKVFTEIEGQKINRNNGLNMLASCKHFLQPQIGTTITNQITNGGKPKRRPNNLKVSSKNFVHNMLFITNGPISINEKDPNRLSILFLEELKSNQKTSYSDLKSKWEGDSLNKPQFKKYNNNNSTIFNFNQIK